MLKYASNDEKSSALSGPDAGSYEQRRPTEREGGREEGREGGREGGRKKGSQNRNSDRAISASRLSKGKLKHSFSNYGKMKSMGSLLLVSIMHI